MLTARHVAERSQLLGCGNTTAKKALDWMHEQGIIGYFAGKNGYGIRVFINRAVSSIGRRDGQKNLRHVHTPEELRHAPAAGASSKDCFLEVQDTDNKSPAPKIGAKLDQFNGSDDEHAPKFESEGRIHIDRTAPATVDPIKVMTAEITARMKSELTPMLQTVAAQTAKQVVTSELIRTRDWFESKAMPKAVRVAQHEVFDLLRKKGFLHDERKEVKASLEVGRARIAAAPEEELTTRAGQPYTEEEIKEAAQICVALMQAQDKSVDDSLSLLTANSSRPISDGDIVRIRLAIASMLK